MKNNKGFSLIELLVVVIIVSIIAAVAVPSVLQGRRMSNEYEAIRACKIIGLAESEYKARHGCYTDDIDTLIKSGFLEEFFRKGSPEYFYEEISVTEDRQSFYFELRPLPNHGRYIFASTIKDGELVTIYIDPVDKMVPHEKYKPGDFVTE
jgi:prepilin-type N-terminal cleavage/methylation domain-containing protein